MKCVNCNFDLEPNISFCGECGTPVPKNEEIEPKKKAFCGECGVQTDGATICLDCIPKKAFCGECGKETTGAILCDECSKNVPIPVLPPQGSVPSIPLTPPAPKEPTKFELFMKKHWKKIAILILLLLLIWFLFNQFVDLSKIEWDEKYGDYESTHVLGGTINLRVNAVDKDDVAINDIKFKVSAGEVTYKNNKAEWTLPNEPGAYKITAETPSGKKITREVTVFEDDFYEILTGGLYADQQEDSLEWKNIDKSPTDIETTYTKISTNSTVVITGKGDMWTTSLDSYLDLTFVNAKDVLSTVTIVSSKGTITTAKLTINYTEEELTLKDLTEDELSIYYFDIEARKLEKIESTIDKENNKVTATITKLGRYVLAGDNVNVNSDIDILFIIDDSVSMYSEAQMIALGYDNSTGAVGNDTEFKRLALSKELIDTFTDNYRFAIAQFAGSYELEHGFTKDKTKGNGAIDGIKNSISDVGGTAIVSALNKGMEDFEDDSGANKYILLMTDGVETSTTISSHKDSIINTAKSKGIAICVIGLSEVDSIVLQEIAEETGCGFYYATEASTLEEIYALFGSSINHNLVSTTDSNKVDSTIIADSGFVITRDGFSFRNFKTKSNDVGHAYGIASFVMGYYTKTLPSSMYSYTKDSYSSDGYSLTGSNFFDYSGDFKSTNLYDYRFETEALSLIFHYPLDYWNRVDKDSNYLVKTSYAKKLKAADIVLNSLAYSGVNKGIKKYEKALIDIDSSKFQNEVTYAEYNLFKALYHLHIRQLSDQNLSFESTPDEAFDMLITELSKGIPLLLELDGKHVVNATRLLKDNKDGSKFKIEVYDSNYPGVRKYIEVTRSTAIRTDIEEHDYKYIFSYEGSATEVVISVPDFE